MIETDISTLDLLPADANTPVFSGVITCPTGSGFPGSAVAAESGAGCPVSEYRTTFVARPCPWHSSQGR